MADTAQLAVMNTALFLLGQEPVTDLNETALEGSLAATKILRQLDTARDTVLQRHGWLCALEYTTLSPVVLAGYANWRYPTVYKLPGNSLAVWEIEGVCATSGAGDGAWGSLWAPRWQVGTFETDAAAVQIIRAQNAQAQLNVAYVRRAAWAALSAHVADAVAFAAAARSAYSVTGDVAIVSELEKAAEAKALLAISTDGTQEGGQAPWAGSIPAAIRNSSR